MAILDAFTQLSDAQALTTTVATTNVIDLKSELGDALESGVWIRAAVQTTFDIANASGGLYFQLQTGDTATIANGVTLAQSATILEATLVAGYEIMKIKLPPNTKRYIRGYFVLTQPATAGNVDVHILTNVDSLITDVEAT